MPSSTQRLQVWRGERLKTSGGLFKKDLIKNKRGKVVSKKKSTQARDKNNLGDFLLKLGAQVKKEEMLHPAGKASKERKDQLAAKPRKPKAAPTKPKVAPPPQPAAPRSKQKKKKALPKGYNPLTRQPYEKKSGMGFVQGGNINLDNIIVGKRRRKPRKLQPG